MKFSEYNIVTENNKGGITVFNTMTTKFVRINKQEELDKFKDLYFNNKPLTLENPMVKAMYDNGYIVDDIDEYEVAKKDVDDLMEKMSKRLMLTIYVTEQCNFRCIYCPEEHISKKLSTTKWNALNKYIKKSVQEGKYETITIAFFGGEPLLETKNIFQFLHKLKEDTKDFTNVKFSHSVVTNGYLLTPKIYDELVSLDVKMFQVTVDGFAETHDKMRPMANGKSSWNKIMENMEYINSKNDNTIIDFRANYNDININTLRDYRNWLHEKFDNKKFRFQFHPVVGFSTGVDENLLASNVTDDKKNILDELHDYKDTRSFHYGHHMLKKYSYICKVAWPSYFTLFTDGRLSKCENLTIPYDYLFIGHLSDEGDFVFTSDMSVWTDNYEFELCKTCKMYPICCARTCPTKKFGYPEERPDCMAKREGYLDRAIEFIKEL